MVAPWPMLSSSGWACTSRRCLFMTVILGRRADGRLACDAAFQVSAGAQQLAELPQERPVGGDPGQAVELTGAQPTHRVVLPGHGVAVDQAGGGDTQHEVRKGA